MAEDFGREPSKITHRTRVALPLVAVVSVVSAIVYGSWQVARYTSGAEAATRQTQEQLRDLKDSQARVESKMNTLDTRLIRVEFKLEPDETPRRRRP